MSKVNLRPSLRRKPKKKEDSTYCTLRTFISLLKKKSYERTPYIKQMTDFLSQNYDYFTKIKDLSSSSSTDNDKLSRIATELKYEYFRKGDKIINCGDEGDKFYIVIQGKVSVCKPIPYLTNISFREYVEYIHNIKFNEKNNAKFRRITSQNAQIDHYALDKINYDFNQIQPSKKTQTYILENEKKLSEFGNGFPFGELALIKREPRNASIYAIENSVLCSLDKVNYNKILRDIEEKRLTRKADEFIAKFPLYSQWGVGQLFRMFNYFEKTTLFNGDYLYKQNEPSNYIYFINSGVFEMTSVFSFAWYEQFIDYIHDSSFSIPDRMDNKAQFTNEENLKAFLKEAQDNIASPCIIKPKQLKPTVSIEEKEMTVLDIKLEEDNLKKARHSYKALIKQITIPECLGYEDALELKPRYASVRCISAQADIDKIQLVEFIKILPRDKVNQAIFQRNVFEKKQVLIQQLKNNAMLQLAKIDSKFIDKYRKAIEKEHMIIMKNKKYANDKALNCTNRIKSMSIDEYSNCNSNNINATIDNYIRNDPLLKTHDDKEDNKHRELSKLFKEKTNVIRINKIRLFKNGSQSMLKTMGRSIKDRSARISSESINNDFSIREGSLSKIREISHKKLDDISNRILESSNNDQLITKGNSSMYMYSNNHGNKRHHSQKNINSNSHCNVLNKSILPTVILPNIKG